MIDGETPEEGAPSPASSSETHEEPATAGLPEDEVQETGSESTLDDGGGHPMPPATFQTHIFHLASQVSMSLGQVANPMTGEKEVDLRAARFLIDTIAMLEEKTRNNRGEEEDTYIAGVLTNLRLEFVNKSS